MKVNLKKMKFVIFFIIFTLFTFTEAVLVFTFYRTSITYCYMYMYVCGTRLILLPWLPVLVLAVVFMFLRVAILRY